MSIKENYNFKVTHSVYYQLFEKKYESKITYDLELVEHYNSKVEIKRHNLKVNDKEIATKFEQIAHTYNEGLFPISFLVKKGTFSLVNYDEISERLTRIDEELKLKYKGPGLEYIRDAFFEKAAKDGYAMVKYMHSFGLINMLRFCLEKQENDDHYEFYWNILPLDHQVFWKGEKHFNPESNTLLYKGQCNGDKELLAIIKTAGNNYQHPDIVTDEESEITTTITQNTQHIATKFDFEFSELNIEISNSYFNYRENLVLTRKQN